MADRPKQFSTLWTTVMKWVATHKPDRLDLLDGLWKGETEDWVVAVNGHDREIEGLAPFHVRLDHRKYLVTAVFGPHGGLIGGGMSEEEAQRSFDALLDGRSHKEWPADGGGVEEDL